MLNDTILAGLVNLFALIGAKSDTDHGKSEKLLNDYLSRHFGLRNTSSYMDLYGDLRSLYEIDSQIDKDKIVEQICSNIKGRINQDELTLMLLRLMEFCHVASDSSIENEEIFPQIAKLFSVDGSIFGEFMNFVLGRESDSVKLQTLPGCEGIFKTLWIAGSSTLLFSYSGGSDVFFNDMPVLPDSFQVWPKSGVLKSGKGFPVYYSTVHLPYDESLTESVTYSGRDVNFHFPHSVNGLHNFTFDLHSGDLVAIMGGSGTGKTTLLSILNGSLKPQSGKLSINGHNINDPKVKELIGYVPQDDLLIEELTVYQNLYYTAKLCFASISDAELDRKVMHVLQDLCLDHARDLVVGSPLNKSISGGQRKRLNIALELIREPAVLFLDEPTSGLSSADTENVMGLLKDQTNKGKLVVVNIHQPSSEVYKLFDRLWLLDKGGYPVFDGNPIDAVTYFKRAANYADAETSTCPACGNVNPEVVLNIIDEKALDNSGVPTANRKTTPEQWHDMYRASRIEGGEPEKLEVPDSGQRKPNRFKQFLIFLERNVKAKLTNRQYLIITLLEAPILAVICGLLTHYAPIEGYTVMDNKNLVTYFFMAVIVATFLGMSGSAEEIIRDRALLKREKYLNLSYGSYILSKVAYSAVVSLIQTALFIIVGNLLMGLHGMFLMWWLILFITSLLSSLIGLLLSQCLNSVVTIYISIPILLIPQILLCGLVVPFSDLNGKSTTGNVPLIGDIIPSRWSYEAIATGSYCYNRYEKPFFDIDKERYQCLFLSESMIYEMESQMETMKSKMDKHEDGAEKHTAIVRKNMHIIEDATDTRFEGQYTYQGVLDYLSQAKRTLNGRGNKLTLEKDKMIAGIIKEKGKDYLVSLKRDNWNLDLENIVTNGQSKVLTEIIDDVIVPKVGAIYLDPVTHNGRAPFYSSSKFVGKAEIPTLWFDLGVLLIMSILLTAILLINLPDKLKKQY